MSVMKDTACLKFAPLAILPNEFRLKERLFFGREHASDLLQNFPL